MTWLRNFSVTWPRICSACSNHNFVLSSFMNYIRVCNGGNTTGAKNGTGTNCPSGYNRFYLVGFELLYRQFSVQCFFPKSSCPFDHIHLAIVLSVILLTASDYPFDICMLFLLIKDEVLITVGCPIFPSILIAKYLFTGSLKNRSIDILETQKKYISMKNSQFFNYLLYAKSK